MNVEFKAETMKKELTHGQLWRPDENSLRPYVNRMGVRVNPRGEVDGCHQSSSIFPSKLHIWYVPIRRKRRFDRILSKSSRVGPAASSPCAPSLHELRSASSNCRFVQVQYLSRAPQNRREYHSTASFDIATNKSSQQAIAVCLLVRTRAIWYLRESLWFAQGTWSLFRGLAKRCKAADGRKASVMEVFPTLSLNSENRRVGMASWEPVPGNTPPSSIRFLRSRCAILPHLRLLCA